MSTDFQHEVWIPAVHRDLTHGVEIVPLHGDRISDLIEQLDVLYPGLKARLCDGERVRPNIAVAINGVISQRGASQRLTQPSEIHFIPAMSGG